MEQSETGFTRNAARSGVRPASRWDVDLRRAVCVGIASALPISPSLLRSYPAYARLLLSRTGDLWVRDFQTYDGIQWGNTIIAGPAASAWSIYDKDGKWIAECTLPPRFAPTEIGADYLIGVSRDEDDVERVTLLSLRK